MNSIKVICIASLVLLISCTPTYNAPSKDDPKAAFISDSSKDFSFGKWLKSRVVAVDNMPIGALFDASNENLPIYEGKHKIVVHTTFKQALLSHDLEAYSNLNANFKAGKKYKIRTSVENLVVKNWITNEDTQEIVSNIGVGVASRPRQVIVTSR